MEFIAIDFETANEKRNSACALGIAVVKDGKITGHRSWLIRPPEMRFEFRNMVVHGIQARDVAGQHSFDVLWRGIRELFCRPLIVAHNAAFDMSVLRASLDHYGLDYPELTTMNTGIGVGCSVVYSKRVWPQLPNRKLDTVSRHLKIGLNHHEAGSDALACAKISLEVFRRAGISSVEEIQGKLGVKSGRLEAGKYKGCGVVK
jgi:DNA polymerase-3 subunit epsilon